MSLTNPVNEIEQQRRDELKDRSRERLKDCNNIAFLRAMKMKMLANDDITVLHVEILLERLEAEEKAKKG